MPRQKEKEVEEEEDAEQEEEGEQQSGDSEGNKFANVDKLQEVGINAGLNFNELQSDL